MRRDPYEVLEVPRTATDEEIKRAYRVLSRKYHPDANINNPNKAQAEEKFKEVQSAYKQIMEEREGGTPHRDPFSDFDGFDRKSYSDDADSEGYRMHLNAAANYIQNGYFQEAYNVLNQMEERTGGWYYLSAIANSGMGNDILALEHARQAVLLEPNNEKYRRLVAQLESGQSWYQGMQNPYRTHATGTGECCTQMFCTWMMCNLCSGGSYYYSMGQAGPFCC